MTFIHLPQTTSTNLWLREHAEDYANEELTVVSTDNQTDGRGCGTNTWESQKGQNLLFSVLCHPKDINATQQFLLLEAMALAVKHTLDKWLPQGEKLKIKWPNDIYWHDRKMGGTLTECALNGQHIKWCIIGTGININQTMFSPQLPNPVSMRQITGHRLSTETLLKSIMASFANQLLLSGEKQTAAPHPIGDTDKDEMQRQYMEALYRRHGHHTYNDAQGEFEAEIIAVAPDGTLTLRDRQQRLRQYRFKEVNFIINNQ